MKLPRPLGRGSIDRVRKFKTKRGRVFVKNPGSGYPQGCSQGVFFTEALAEFQYVNNYYCMIGQIWEVKRVACHARAETFTEAVASVASMVATPLIRHWYMISCS